STRATPHADHHPLPLPDALPISATDQPQRESAAAAADITPEIDPTATAETVPPETGAASTRTDTDAEADQGAAVPTATADEQPRSEEHTSELQSRENLVCRLLLE